MVSLHDIREHVASLFIMLNKNTVILFRIEFLVVLVTLLFFAMFVMDYYRRVIHNSFMRALFSIFDAVSDSIVVYLLGAMQTASFKNQLFPVWALVLVNFRYSADYISGYGVPDRRGRRYTEWRNVFKLLGSAFLNMTRGSRFSGPLWLFWGLQIVRSGYRFWSHMLASQALWHGRSSELVAEHMRNIHDERGDNGGGSFKPETMQGYEYLVYGETKHKKKEFKLKKPQYTLSLPTTDQYQHQKDLIRVEAKTPSCSSKKKKTNQQDQQDGTNNANTVKSTRQQQQQQQQQQQHNNNNNKKKKKKKTKNKTPPPPLVTLENIWSYGPIDQQQPQEKGTTTTNNNEAEKKDLPLAFALSRLLRCRFEDVTLQRCIFDTNRALVKSIIAGKVGASDALRIMELQLAFVHDYFNTRYPMVFWCGLPSLFITLLLSVLTMGAVVWLAVEIRKVYKPPSGELANLVKGFNVDTIITWLFILLMIVKEIWEILTYLRSDWTRLIMGCEYVQRKLSKRRQQEWSADTIEKKEESSADTCKDRILLQFSTSPDKKKITDDDRRWHGFIDQYVFVESYDDRPWFWNLIHTLSTGIVPKKDDGAKLSSAIQVPDCVRQAVMDKLDKLTKDKDGREVGNLPKRIMTLSNSNTNDASEELQRYQEYTAARPRSTTTGGGGGGAVYLPTASHVILVWHIATSLCEMELATKHRVDLGSPWFSSLCSSKPYLLDVDDKGCCSSLSCFTNCCCSSSKSNGKSTEEKKKKKPVSGKLPAGDLRRTYIIANSLSRYCAYLLVSKPDLIPDSFLVPQIVFQKTVRSARDGIFKDSAGSLKQRYGALNEEAVKSITDTEIEDVLKQGAKLGKELLNLPTDEGRWKILAGVWTELLIHIAPTWNAQAHMKCLSAGEFITHIWALLWHCGIQKSSLWPKDTGPENSSEKQPHEGNSGGDRAAIGIETRRTGGYIGRKREHMGITIFDEADDNKKEVDIIEIEDSFRVPRNRMITKKSSQWISDPEKSMGYRRESSFQKSPEADGSSTTSTGLQRMDQGAGRSEETREVSGDETKFIGERLLPPLWNGKFE